MKHATWYLCERCCEELTIGEHKIAYGKYWHYDCLFWHQKAKRFRRLRNIARLVRFVVRCGHIG